MYQAVLVLKFLAVMGFAGGVIAAFTSNDLETRKRAAHRVAAPSLLATWVCGYLLAGIAHWPLAELWIVFALALSLIANAVLVICVTRDLRGIGAFTSVAAPIACTVALMVFKPTWGIFR
jgi:uncharacterized membrane protein